MNLIRIVQKSQEVYDSYAKQSVHILKTLFILFDLYPKNPVYPVRLKKGEIS